MAMPVPERIKQRLRVKTLLDLNWSSAAISQEVECSESTVWRWKRRFNAGGNEQDLPGRGRKRRLTPALEKQVVKRVTCKRKRSLRKTSTWLRSSRGIEASKDTVARTIKRDDLKPYHRRKQQKITAKQKTKRVAFARAFMDHDWMKTLMTDETEFAIVHVSNLHNDVVWAHNRDEVPPCEVDKNAVSLKFWAGASATGRTKLHFYTGNVTSTSYVNLLQRALPEITGIFRDRHWTFQHDGAPAHSAHATSSWLDHNAPEYISSGPDGDWPAKSPDLNWIENLWGIMSERLEEGNPPRSLSALKRRLIQIWKEIPQETLQRCAASMPTRLRDVIRKRGNAIEK
jgi:transposase